MVGNLLLPNTSMWREALFGDTACVRCPRHVRFFFSKNARVCPVAVPDQINRPLRAMESQHQRGRSGGAKYVGDHKS
jgi:hypothetical protein